MINEGCDNAGATLEHFVQGYGPVLQSRDHYNTKPLPQWHAMQLGASKVT
jgi:hypothetical protein